MSIEPELELPTTVNASVVGNFIDAQSRRTSLPHDEEARTDLTEDTRQIDTNQAQMKHGGKYGKLILWIAMAIMWTAFEVDHTVLYNYVNYAASDFNQISTIGALQTAGTIIIAVMKPPIAKISDVAGRMETYFIVIALFVVAYVLSAAAPTFGAYAGGYLIYSIAATGMQILNQIIVADITTSRWRGLANALIELPFIIVPWLSAFIVDSALKNIGWRWGIGMFAIIMPVVSLSIIVPLFWFRRRAKKSGIQIRRPANPKEFFDAVDVIGVTLLAIGCAMFLLPIALAGDIAGGWSNAWVPAVLVVGLLFLAVFGVYETKYAKNPVMPSKYFKSMSMMLACIIGLLDAFSFQVTHTYMYAWSTVAHNFSARDATFLTYTSGCLQVVAGLITGFFMYRYRRYKWLLIAGAIIRLIGYGVMLRLRGASNPTWELFIVQIIQGLGSGCVGTIVLVVAQVIVPRAELAQATALILLAIFMGQAIGSAVAGAIYTNLFRSRLRVHLGDNVSQSTIDKVFQSITGKLPAVGTPERTAINDGYSDILRYMTISALVASAVPMIMVWFLPNLQLNDQHNLAEEHEPQETGLVTSETSESSSETLVATPPPNTPKEKAQNENQIQDRASTREKQLHGPKMLKSFASIFSKIKTHLPWFHSSKADASPSNLPYESKATTETTPRIDNISSDTRSRESTAIQFIRNSSEQPQRLDINTSQAEPKLDTT